MRVYATAEQLADFTGQPAPDNADTLLRIASRVVDRLLVGVVYETAPTTGLPTDGDVTTALSDAACAIAAELAATGVLAAGSTQQWDSVGIGNVSLSGRTNAPDTTVVHGVPVPAAARLALAAVGRVQVVVRC